MIRKNAIEEQLARIFVAAQLVPCARSNTTRIYVGRMFEFHLSSFPGRVMQIGGEVAESFLSYFRKINFRCELDGVSARPAAPLAFSAPPIVVYSKCD